jgi:amino acid adenylation domain-containing protein
MERASQATGDSRGTSVGPAPDTAPLTPLQLGMLFEQRSGAGGTGVNIEQVVVEFDRPPDPVLLERGWNRVVARHSALRSRFLLHEAGEPAQEFPPGVAIPFAVHDGPPHPGEDPDDALERFLAHDRTTGFDPEQAPLTRVTLLKLVPDRHIMVWTSHHLVIDGTSLEIVLAELAKYLESPGHVHEPPSAAPCFSEFVRWLGRREQSQSAGYWRRQLADTPLPTPLRIDRGQSAGSPRPAEPARAGRSLDPQQTARLREFADSIDVTINNLVQAAWAILLHRYSGEDQVVFGAVRNGRHTPLPGMNERVGLFINTLPVVARFSGDLTLAGLVRSLRENWLALRDHEHGSAAEIRDAAGIDPGTPLFETATVFDGRPLEHRLREAAPALPVRSLRTIHQTSLPLFLGAQCGMSLSLELDYDAARFPHPVVTRLLDQLVTLLEASPDHADSTVTAIPWLPEEEKRGLLDQPEPTPPIHRSYPDAFREAVERHAGRVAMRWDGGQCSYRELDRWSNRITNLLIRRGVQPGDHVAVLLPRTPELPVSLLAVLKTGAAYLPINPAHPAERISRILTDSDAACVITDRAGAATLPDGTTIISLDAEKEAIARDPDHDPRVEIPPDADAYLIYTSGSTGEPKGVRVTHRNLLSHNTAFLDYAALEPDDRALQFGSISFDASAEEIYPTWLAGARLVLRPENLLDSLDRFTAWVESEQVTILNLPTAFWHELARGLPDLSLPDCVRLVVIGGEEASLDAWRQWAKHVPAGVLLVNSYGPTETTISATAGVLGSPRPGDLRVPIGKALGNTRLYILDPQREPVGIGVPGELYIGGLGVGPGYWMREQLTAERFLPDPFSCTAGARMFRSGDRACWREDGQVEFLGRLDLQVKVRGFRIELGEVENTLARHPDLAAAMAAGAPTPDGGLQINAHLVAAAGRHPDATRLRRWLGQRLPDYMVPATFILHDRFPVTPNGKIDRRKITHSGTTLEESQTDQPRGAPHTETERSLQAIWGGLLARRTVPCDRSFFDLGGDSLRALRMVLEVERRLDCKLPLGVMLQTSTITDLATLVDSLATANNGTGSPDSLTLLRNGDPGSDAAPLVLVHGGDGGALVFQQLNRHLATGRAVYVIESPALTSPGERAADIPSVAREYIRQLHAVSPGGPWLLGGYSFGGVVAYEMARQLAQDGIAVPLVVLFDTPAPNEEYPRRSLRGRIAWFWARCHRLRMPWHRKLTALATRFVTGLLISTRVKLEEFYAGLFRNSSSGGPRALRHLVIRDYHERIASTYQAGSYAGRVVLFRAENQGDKFAPARSLGWERLVGEQLEVIEVPGGHLTILEAPHAASLARALDDSLENRP